MSNPIFKTHESEYEKFVDRGAFYHKHHTLSREEISYLGLGISGEAGECADAIKKVIRSPNFEEALAQNLNNIMYEASDNLWYIVQLCRFAGITLEDLRIMNTVKLYERLIANGQEEYAVWPYVKMSYEEAKDHTVRLEVQLRNIA